MVLACREERVIELAIQSVLAALFLVVEGSDGRLEVARIGETVRADGPEFGKLVVALIQLTDIASYGARGEGYTVSNRGLTIKNRDIMEESLPDTAGNDADLIRTQENPTQLRLDIQHTVLRHN